MKTRRLAALLAFCATAAPAYAGPADSCTAFAVPPRQEDRYARADGGVWCGGSARSEITVDVCVEAFAYFAGWLSLGCQQTMAAGSVSALVGSVTVCHDPDFPLMRTTVTAWTDWGESAYAESALSTAFCIR